ncbi:MAG: DUF2817 domain-containing protein [Ilumatobacteraceae bacterium]
MIDLVLPLTYDECRARFRRVAGAAHESHPIEARGPDGAALTIDVARAGDPAARRVLVVLSGVHGVEGFAPSAIQCELLGYPVPPGVRLVVVHAINPWGMTWYRRQNESNVDLNRNWARDRVEPPANPGYAELHDLLVPGGDEPPSAESFINGMRMLRERHGLAWLRAAISGGQYSHPDGLYFGGGREEVSTRLLRSIAETHLSTAELVVTVDLHTGHGAFGTCTLLSHDVAGTAGDAWLRRWFSAERIEATAGNPDATAVPKVGQLARGLAQLLPAAQYHDVTFELGTVRETRMILAERAEHWVHRHGDRDDPAHAAAVWEHRICSTPDDPGWERSALEHGRRVLDQALSAVATA